MTNEPVAYYKDYNDGKTLYFSDRSLTEKDKSDPLIKPLYTKEQLQPRVKMTKGQYKQFENYKVDKNNFYHFWQSLLVDDVSLFKDISERDLMLVWLDDGAIEIVPDMKWFVRTKELDDGLYKVLEDIRLDYYEYGNVENDEETAEYGYPFDTKEQAEEWTNPLTEAVLLPVEGE